MTRYLILATILLIAGLFITFRPKAPVPSELQSNGRNQFMRSTTESAAQLADIAEPSRTKSKIRILHAKPTIEQTEELLSSIVIPVLDLPRQTLAERVIVLNHHINECGVRPDQLTITIEEDDSAAERPVANVICPKVRIRNIPIAVALKYTADSTILRYRVLAGRVECFSSSSIHHNALRDHSVEPLDPNDPFAEP